MSKVVKIKKGLDIPIKGAAPKELKDMPETLRFAVKPPDFKGLDLKLKSKQDTEVKAGDVLMFDKKNNDIVLVSPVSGKVVEVNRGEKRRILEVVVETTNPGEIIKHQTKGIDGLSREEIIKLIQSAGLWPYIIMRPYGIVARPDDKPRDIFISTFDSSPLGPDLDFALQDQKEDFFNGLKVLAKLTEGEVCLGLNKKNPGFFDEAKDVRKTYFNGPHPAGNVGIQIHNSKPLAKGDIAWTVQAQNVAMIGKLIANGEVTFDRTIAFAGSEVTQPGYYKVKVGADLNKLLDHTNKEEKLRYISGNVLTGTKVDKHGYLGFYDSMVTVIPEGDEYEFFGWAMPRFKHFSISRAYFSWLMPGKKYKMNANMHGEERAFVITGEYEKVLPMDVMPVQLLKSAMYEDIDEMEKLGIFEVIEEDMALCEFVCTSKMEVQSILRKGMDLMIKETM
ncbi:MAG: NADH:ubiquinone reductase (Na(+)-transporting) subunit A [Salinivirgaceae bacterium]|nr:MAG: NADH:ubiquinone reductase (Na(+)-transporting) subunit A [Salinivirgaceae bacterium]